MEYSDIMQFSRDLFLKAYEELPFEELLPYEDIDDQNPPIFIEAAATTLDYFRDAFCMKFEKVHVKLLAEVVVTDEQFFRYVIPLCLKLVEDDNNYYFSFMLVAAFISELNYRLTCHRNCYRLTGVAHKCLVAVFKRRFEDTFEENGGWEGLRLFCVKISTFKNTKFKTFGDILTGGDSVYKKQIHQRIKQCDINLCENFILSSDELLLITTDDQLVLEAELNAFAAKAIDPPLEVEWKMVKDDECVKVCSRFDDESGTVISTFVPGFDAEPATVLGSGAEPATVLGSGAEPATVLGSGAEPDAVLGLDDEFAAVLGSDDEFAAVLGSDDEPLTTRSSDAESTDDPKSSADGDSSVDSFVDWDDAEYANFASTFINHLQPEEYHQKMSARVCKWCNQRCFAYAKYFYMKHKELSASVVF